MEFWDYAYAEKQQDKLRQAAKGYKPKHPPGWYVKYLKKLGTWSLDHVHPQDENRRGFLYVFFSCPTQHVWGNSLEECLDIAHEGGNQWRRPE
jgi:hypothetical protein